MYRLLFTATGVAAIALGAVLIVAPQVYLSLYVVLDGPQTVFAAQRLAPAIAGLGALLVLARDLPVGRFSAQFAGLASLVWFGIAATGVYHYLTSVAGFAILIAAAIEVILGALFLRAARQMRTA